MAFKNQGLALILFAAALIVGFYWALSSPPSWNQLRSDQRRVLEPLSREWNGFSDERKLKWLGIVERYSQMTPLEQSHLQTRMSAWVKLSTLEREKARLRYLHLRASPIELLRELPLRWQEYKTRALDSSPLLTQQPLGDQSMHGTILPPPKSSQQQ